MQYKKQEQHFTFHLVDPTFRNINRFFVLWFKKSNDDPTGDSFDEYYMSLVKIKNFNALIDNKLFSYQLVKNKPEAHEKPIENLKKQWLYNRKFVRLVDHQKYYKLFRFIKTNHFSTH